MELNRVHFRAIIFYNFRRGLTQQQCMDELKYLYGDEAPSYGTVKNWYNEFNRGRRSLNDVSVKVVQKQSLCQRTLMPYVN